MVKKIAAPTTLVLFGAMMLGACSSDGVFGFTDTGTAAATTAALPERPKSDPACQALAARIAELKQDGAVDRVEKAAQGKGDTVSVKRASLAKVGELNKANADFQSRCSAYRGATAAAGAQPTVTQPAGATTTAAVGKQADAAGAKAKAAAKATKSE